jgi:thiosulfate/3-mercaptopyruvate sulfurtransferase
MPIFGKQPFRGTRSNLLKLHGDSGWRNSIIWLCALVLATFLAAPPTASAAEPLISVETLRARLGEPDLVILDIRSAIDGSEADAYAKGHIPGAIASDYDKSGWRATRNGLPYMLPSVAQLEKLIGELGIDEDSQVVVVPAGVSATDFGAATRVYWTLKVAGVNEVSILDGGLAAWTAAKYPLETRTITPSPRIFTATINKALIAELADVEKLAASADGTLLDARPPEYFTGKLKVDAVGAYGHIPRSINIDSAEFYDPATNRLRPRDQLAAISSRVSPASPVITYCNSGHWSSTDWFVLSELLGRKDVRLYYGSMIEWSALPQRPVSSSRIKWDDIKKFFGLGT